jgi:DNA-binding transcriptional regulator of glucitol operon
VAAALVVAFLALGWWQIQRAVAGNILSIGYAAEWPLFAAFVVFVWVKEIRRERAAATAQSEMGPDGRPAPSAHSAPPVRSTRPERTGPGYDDSDDQELAAYNRYLAWLASHPQASRADYLRLRGRSSAAIKRPD